jgi:hypothetical protein
MRPAIFSLPFGCDFKKQGRLFKTAALPRIISLKFIRVWAQRMVQQRRDGQDAFSITAHFWQSRCVPSAAEPLSAGAYGGSLSFLLRFDIKPVAFTFKLPLFSIIL